MSACGWPEPCTGITLPRGQSLAGGQVPAQVVELADRALEVLLADLVVGGRWHGCLPFFGAGPGPLRVHQLLPRATRLAARPPRSERAAAAAAGLQELQRLDVDEVLVLADDVGVAHRLQELLRPLEVLQPDHHAAESLGDVAVRAGAGDDAVLAGEADRLLVERVDAIRGLKTSRMSISSTTSSRCS